MSAMKEFYLERIEDETGVSGTGVVARGVILPSGRTVLEWQTFRSSVTVYDHFEDVEVVHGHHGKTKVVMGIPPEESPKQPKKGKKKSADSPNQ